MYRDRVVIFGDSFADNSADDKQTSWPSILAKLTERSFVLGLCGTSSWWSYNNFTNYVKDNNPECIIFCYTSPYRWPSLPKELEGTNWNIHSVNTVSLTPLLTTFNQYYLDIFPTELSDLIAKTIFDLVNEYCKQHNIYLINLICFGTTMLDCKSEFPVIRNIDDVSHRERIHHKDVVYSVTDMIKQFNMNCGDPRICHLGNKNNKRLADILYSMIQQKTTNVDVDVMAEYAWEQFDTSNDERFNIALEQYKKHGSTFI